jgi:hypothetical protein
MINGETLERVEEVLEERYPDKETPLYVVERDGNFIFCDDSFLFQLPSEDVEDCDELDWLFQVAEQDGIEHASGLKHGTAHWTEGYKPSSELKISWSDAGEDELEYFECDVGVLEVEPDGVRVFYCQAYLTVFTLIFGKVFYKICRRERRKGKSCWPLVVYKHRRPVGVIMNMTMEDDDEDE